MALVFDVTMPQHGHRLRKIRCCMIANSSGTHVLHVCVSSSSTHVLHVCVSVLQVPMSCMCELLCVFGVIVCLCVCVCIKRMPCVFVSVCGCVYVYACVCALGALCVNHVCDTAGCMCTSRVA